MNRSDLAALPPYVPGRHDSRSVVLSSNERPRGPSPTVAEAVRRAGLHAHRYPDFGAVELTGRLAGRHRLAPGNVAVGCGSVGLCQQLIHAVCAPGDEVMFGWRSFEAYPTLARIGHTRARPIPLTPDLRLDLPAMVGAVTPATRLMFITNPNNPTGTTVDRHELRAVLESVPDRVVVALDEAYHDYVDDPEVADGMTLLEHYPRLVVLRTFSKAWGLAGLRVGYAAGAPETIRAVRDVGLPFAVSGPAQAAALAALDLDDEVRAHCRETILERARVERAVRLLGFAPPPSRTNFVWLPLGSSTTSFAEHLEQAGVLVRPFRGEGIRVTIGTPAENDLFLRAAGRYRADAPPARRQAR